MRAAWADIYCLVGTSLGKSDAEVGAMEWWYVERLVAYWRKWPPQHVLLAMIAKMIGWKPAEGDDAAAPSRDEGGETVINQKNTSFAELKRMAGFMPGMAVKE